MLTCRLGAMWLLLQVAVQVGGVSLHHLPEENVLDSSASLEIPPGTEGLEDGVEILPDVTAFSMESMRAIGESQDNGTLSDATNMTTKDTAASLLEDVARAMDPSADACTDFYQHACGGWLNTTVQPADQSSWSKTFSEIGDRNLEILRTMYSSSVTPSYQNVSAEEVEMVRQFYASCMDEDGRNARGMQDPDFVAIMTEIADVSTISELVELHASFFVRGIEPGLFQFGSGADAGDPKQTVPFIVQGGLGLPSEEYYGLKEDNERFQEVRRAYVVFMSEVIQMGDLDTLLGQWLGESQDNSTTHDYNHSAALLTDPRATAVLQFETELAKVSWDHVQMQDPVATYNPTTIGAFKDNHTILAPWFDRVGANFSHFANDSAKLLVEPPSFFTGLSKLLNSTSLDTLKAYIAMQVISSLLPYLNTDAGNILFEFYGRLLNGQQERAPLWKRCVAGTLGSTWGMGDRMFVEEHFGAEGKQLAEEMVESIKEAFDLRLDAVSFMDADTSAAAKEKLGAMRYMIGYPEIWPTYPGLTINDDYLQNMLSSASVETARDLNRSGTPVDPDRWSMNPSEVNAYYDPTKNVMVFPAGILQPPFFSRDAPMVLNYASIGGIMGHELTHGFDNNGAQYDDEGRLRLWWSQESMNHFKRRVRCMETQYAGMEVPELAGTTSADLKINGELTAGENIADTGGILTSLQAYRHWASENGSPTHFTVGGANMTDDRLFWLGYAQSWCELRHPSGLMVQIRTDPHAPARARGNGPAQNSLEFAAALGCAEGTPMNPANKCAVWEADAVPETPHPTPEPTFAPPTPAPTYVSNDFFSRCDTDGSGKLSHAELLAALTSGLIAPGNYAGGPLSG